MEVSVKSSYLVKPSEPTWNGILPLTELDQTGTMLHESIVYFYAPSQAPIIQTLKTSLAKTLVHFYPFAGRLNWTSGSLLQLNCNADGALLTEAESDSVLDDLAAISSSPQLYRLIPEIDYDAPIQEMPLFAAQLTKFKCGGISLGVAQSHVVADGQACFHFLTEWTRFSRGKPLASTPFLDRKVLGAGDICTPPKGPVFEQYTPPPLILGQSSNERERKKETKVCVLRVSKCQIDALRADASDHKISDTQKVQRDYTRYEVITAHVWRCATKARNHKPEQPTGVCTCVDFRKRVDPQLPNSYFGNAIIDVVATGVSGEIISSPLGHVAAKIRNTIDGVTSEYVDCVIGYLKQQEDLSNFQELRKMKSEESVPFYGNPNLCVISWMYLPLQGLDFGWGQEIHIARGSLRCDGDVVIRPNDGDDDGSLLVDICLQVEHIEDFKKYFYQGINNVSN